MSRVQYPIRGVFLAKTASCAPVVRAVSPARPSNFPHSARTTRTFVQSGFYEVATTQRVARLGPRPHRTLKIPRNNQKLYIDERFRQLGLSAPRRPTDSASLNRSGLTFQRTIRSPRVREPGDGGSGPCLTALGLFIDPFCRQAAAAAAWPSSRVGCAQRDPSRRAPRRHCPRWARPRGDFGQHQHPPLWRWRSRREHRHTSLARAR